jgi:DNA-binding NtrC family response regulator
VDLLKDGAWDYIVKDEDTRNRLLNALRIIRKTSRIQMENENLKAQIGRKYDIKSDIIGSSETIKKIFSKLEKALDSTINVSIIGETGTGKELIARAIHYNSRRKNDSFVAVNLAAVPGGLIESELFGHEKGAFTWANQRRIGKTEEADQGTIFLDEIAEMSPEVQVKLLRVLQEREFSRVGGNETVKLKARQIQRRSVLSLDGTSHTYATVKREGQGYPDPFKIFC